MKQHSERQRKYMLEMHNVSHYQYGSKSTENEPFGGSSWPSWQLQGLL